MKFSISILSILSVVSMASAAGPTSNTVAIAVEYVGGITRSFKFGDCIPFSIDGNVVEFANVVSSSTYFVHEDPNCAGGTTPPVGIPLPAGAISANVIDFIHLVGKSAKCEKNSLPGLPPV